MQLKSRTIRGDGLFGQGQGLQFLILFGLLAIISPFLIGVTWQATSELHTLFELAAVILALVVAGLLFIYHRHSRRDAQFYFVAFAFLGAALLDTIHMVLTSSMVATSLPSPLIEVAPWSWLASRVVFASFLLLNAATLSAVRTDKKRSREKQIYALLFIVALGISALLVFLLAPLPQAIFLGLTIPRPQEAIVIVPLALALVLYYRKRAQVQDPLFPWMLACIIISLLIQVSLIPWSHQLYDAAFNWAHIAKIVSYLVVLIGLVYGLTDIIDQLRANRDEIRRQNAELSAEIAERARAEHTIRIYRDIVDNMRSGVYVIQWGDPDDLGSFQFVLGNRAAEVATGQSLEPVLNQRLDEIAPELMETEFPLLYKQVLQTQQPLDLGDIHYPGEGERAETYFSAWLIPLDERHLAAIFEDITERKKIENDLLASREALSEAQRLAHIGSWAWDLNSNTVSWSDEFYRIHGYAPNEFSLNYDSAFLHIYDEDLELVQATVAKALEDGERFEYDYRMKTVQGDIRTIHALGYVEMQPDENGQRKASKMWGTAQDITEQRLNENERRRNELRLAQALNLSRMGFWEWDPTTDKIFISTELSPILGYDKESRYISFDEFMQLIHDDDRIDAQQVMRSAFTGKGPLHTKFRIHHSDNSERGIECMGTTVTDDQGQVTSVWGTCQDITERLRLESQNQQYAARLEASNRDLQDFAYIASHDLQEPLRKISAFGNRLAQLNQETLDEKSLDYLNRMQDAAQRMQALINDLLTLSRVNTQGQPLSDIDLNIKVERVLRDLETQIEQTQGRVEASELPVVKADRVQMQQLFQNLISNGLKFRRPEEPPVIRIYTIPTPATKADKFPNNPTVTVVVEDNGIGFEQQYADKIFQPFQRLHGRNAYEGTGMGLAICRRIMERHGGVIWAESTMGEGAKFFLTFPMNEQSPPPRPGPGNAGVVTEIDEA